MRYWFYIIRACWRSARGRWYVWRDAPTDIVRRVAVLWYHNRRKGEEHSEVIESAYNEHKLRKKRGGVR